MRQAFNLVQCGDFDLNISHPHSHPTLIPSTKLEEVLDIRRRPALTENRKNSTQTHLAIHAHIFYIETIDSIVRQLLLCEQGLGSYDLWISTNESAKAARIRTHIAESCGVDALNRTEIRVCGNSGRNIGPLLDYLWTDLKKYDLLLHVHGKRSVESDLGNSWRQQLLETLLPSHSGVDEIIGKLKQEDKVGLLIPQAPEEIRKYLNWGNNFDVASIISRVLWRNELELLDNKELERDSVLAFPAGMMFWCRPAALEPLALLYQEIKEAPMEPLGLDGTILHAIERLVAHSCEAGGYQWNMLTRSSFSERRSEWLRSYKQEARISVWDSNRRLYQQAMAFLARDVRESWELLTCSEQNLENCMKQLEELQQQLMRMNEMLAKSHCQIESMERSVSRRLTAPLRRVLKWI